MLRGATVPTTVLAAWAALAFAATTTAQQPGPDAKQVRSLAQRLQDPDAAQRSSALRQVSFVLVPQQHVAASRIEPYIVDAFANGYPDLRTELGIRLRLHIGIRWPTRLVQHILEHGEGGPTAAEERRVD